MAVAWEAVKARLVSALPAVVGPGVTVFDGPTVSGRQTDSYLTIGFQPSTVDESAGDFEQGVGPDGFSATETGSVLCELGAVTGSPSVPSVFASFDAIASHVQSDQTLGGALRSGSTVTVAADVVQGQTQAGALQRLLVTVSYFTRLA